MASLNKIMIIGNTGRDAELRMTPNGKPVASFSVAVNRNYTREGGEREEQTEWFNIVCWGDRLSSFAQQYVTKGRLVFVDGRLQTRKWKDREGAERTTLEIVANDIQLLGGRRDGDGGAPAERPQQQPNEAGSGTFDPDEIPF